VRIKAEAANAAAQSMGDPFAKQLRLMPELKVCVVSVGVYVCMYVFS
jgi:hypothetical protein